VNTGPLLVTTLKVVVLDGENQWDSVFIFKTTATVTVGAAARVILKNGAQAKNVFWVAGGLVSIAASCEWSGVVLAKGGVTFGASAILTGRAFAIGSIVTAGAGAVINLPETESNECSFAHTCV
jgi:hypothetical protein